MHRILVVDKHSNGCRLYELQLCRLWEHFLESRQTIQPAHGTLNIECDKVKKSEATDKSVRARSLTLFTDLQPHATLSKILYYGTWSFFLYDIDALWMNYEVYILR